MDMTGWKVGDDERIDWQFPDGYVIQPYQFVTIFGGGGDIHPMYLVGLMIP